MYNHHSMSLILQEAAHIHNKFLDYQLSLSTIL